MAEDTEDRALRSYTTVMPAGLEIRNRLLSSLVGVPSTELSHHEKCRLDAPLECSEMQMATVSEMQSGAIHVETFTEDSGLSLRLVIGGTPERTQLCTVQDLLLGLSDVLSRIEKRG